MNRQERRVKIEQGVGEKDRKKFQIDIIWLVM
jgi:hypothetical protein